MPRPRMPRRPLPRPCVRPRFRPAVSSFLLPLPCAVRYRPALPTLRRDRVAELYPTKSSPDVAGSDSIERSGRLKSSSCGSAFGSPLTYTASLRIYLYAPGVCVVFCGIAAYLVALVLFYRNGVIMVEVSQS